MLHGLAKVVVVVVFLALCQTKPNRSLTNISKLVEASCWFLGNVVCNNYPSSIHFSGCTRRGKDQRGPKTWVPLHPRPLCGGYWKEAEGHQTCHHHQNLTHIVSIISIQDTDWQKSWPWLIMKWSGGRESTKINGSFNLGKIGPGREKERGGNFALLNFKKNNAEKKKDRE